MKTRFYLPAIVLLVAVLGMGSALGQSDAATRTFVDSRGREVKIPAQPQRVVTLQDQNALLPLWELGFRNVVASVGAIDENGDPYFRRMEEHGFDTSSVAFLSVYGEPDLEALLALRPDLIVAPSFHEDIYDTLSQIAPTVVIDVFDAPIDEVMLRFGRLVSLEDRARELAAEYEARLEELTELAGDPSEIVVSVISTAASGGADLGQFYFDPGGSVEEVLRAVGFARPKEQLTAETREHYSVERLRNHDADLLLRLTFRQRAADEEENTRALKESLLWPRLNAVQKGQAYDVNGEATVGTGYSPRFAFIDAMTEFLEGLDTSGDLTHVEVAVP